MANKDALINFIEHSSYNFVQRDMILAIARKLISNGFELKKSTNGISTKKRTQDINHPAITAHIKDLHRSGVKEKSVNGKYKISYALFLNWLNKTHVQFQSTSCDELSNCFYDIRFLLANLYKLGWFAKDITMDVTGIPYERYYYRELPKDAELQCFFHNIQLYSDHPTLELAAFGLMLCLGLRIHEVANIRYQDIHVENRTISVFGKNEKSAILPLPDPLQNYFQKLVVNKSQDVHLFGNNSQSTIRKLRAQYKLYSFISGWKYPGGPHLLRRFPCLK